MKLMNLHANTEELSLLLDVQQNLTEFRAGKALSRKRNSCTYSLSGTLTLSNQLKSYLDMSHSPALVIPTSPCKAASDLGSHTEPCSVHYFTS